MVYKRHHAL
jgi:C1A family cysteine protease